MVPGGARLGRIMSLVSGIGTVPTRYRWQVRVVALVLLRFRSCFSRCGKAHPFPGSGQTHEGRISLWFGLQPELGVWTVRAKARTTGKYLTGKTFVRLP